MPLSERPSVKWARFYDSLATVWELKPAVCSKSLSEKAGIPITGWLTTLCRTNDLMATVTFFSNTAICDVHNESRYISWLVMSTIAQNVSMKGNLFSESAVYFWQLGQKSNKAKRRKRKCNGKGNSTTLFLEMTDKCYGFQTGDGYLQFLQPRGRRRQVEWQLGTDSHVQTSQTINKRVVLGKDHITLTMILKVISLPSFVGSRRRVNRSVGTLRHTCDMSR
eukprot:scaffold695_cov113-Cylindrotheca_fusiformis.AAC.5